jgi:hypothetical protein
VGVDLVPLPGTPVRLSVERRVAIGREAATPFPPMRPGGSSRALPARSRPDGYAQAGVVGARRGDLFAEGAVRLSHRTPVGPGLDLRLGAGAWGAAQPGVSRVDVGPRAALSSARPGRR